MMRGSAGSSWSFSLQAGDVHVYGSGFGAAGVDAPDGGEEFFAGDGAVGVAGEIAEELHFLFGELGALAGGEADFTAGEVGDAAGEFDGGESPRAAGGFGGGRLRRGRAFP